MSEFVDVGIGEVKIASSPQILRTHLGSCVGVVLYDPALKRGGYRPHRFA